ncbi:sodium:dicarboxylate symporter [Powellomyces hirtus]|nr:sodium:dicarboxylate symporter [Powellomyces hirtus]
MMGLLAPKFSKEYLGLLSSHIFLPMVKSLIVPLIFSLLIVGIAGHGDDIARVGRLGAKSIAYFMCLTVIAIFVGLAFGNLIKPGVNSGLDLCPDGDRTCKKPNATEPFTIGKQLNDIIPVSFFGAAANNKSLQITFCAVMFAWACMLVPNKDHKRVIVGFFDAVAGVMLQVVNLVMRFTPLAIGGSLAKTVASNGIGSLAVLGKLIGTVYAGLFAFTILILLPVALIARVPIIPFLKAVRDPIIIAFTTASSDAALAIAMENMIALGCPAHIVSFVIPVGYSFNLDGTTLYLGTAVLFVAQVDGQSWPIGEQIVRMFLVLLMSKGIAGVPRASLVILQAACETWGLPTEVILIILGIDEICDMARTSINLLGNCLACVVISRWEGDFVLNRAEKKDDDDTMSVLPDPENPDGHSKAHDFENGSKVYDVETAAPTVHVVDGKGDVKRTTDL